MSLNRDPISKEQGAACAEHLRKSRGLQAGATLVWCGGSSAETTYQATPRGTQSKGPAPGALPAGECTLAGCRDNPDVSLPLAVCLSSSQTCQLLTPTPWAPGKQRWAGRLGSGPCRGGTFSSVRFLTLPSPLTLAHLQMRWPLSWARFLLGLVR